MRRASFAACLLAGCAAGRSAGDQPDAAVSGPADAKVWRDGQIEGTPDAQQVQPDDAAVVVMLDAYECQPQTQQLLMNPVLDLNPSGMGWIQQNIDNLAPIITGDDGVAEHSPPFKAWMGGMEGYDYGVNSLTDALYQDVTIPMGTTELRLTGQYDVRTMEFEAGTFDTAQLALVQTNGTPVETVKSLSNGTPTTAWTAINHAFANPTVLAGQTLRIRITSTNDVIEPTSFFFDTLALTATVCK